MHKRSIAAFALSYLAACGGGPDSGPDAGPAPGSAADLASLADGALPIIDADEDGLDDGKEQAWAEQYLPYLAISPADGCARGGIIVRVRPHPADPALLHILYDHLFERDCGLTKHVGDNEVSAATIDPRVPPPAGILVVKSISHQDTLCQRVSTCGACGGLPACETLPKAGVPWPVIWYSRDKHGSYVNRTVTCAPGATCLDICEDPGAPTLPPIVNVGEPGHPLVSDLTAQGFITAANGWTEAALMGFDPWKPGQRFGNAGTVSADLVDPAFDTIACPK